MNISDIDLKSLEVLEALLTERNVTRAAARVGLSQPAASNALARLRRVLGDPLVVRTRKGMIPTERGRSLLKPIQDLRRILEQVLEPEQEFSPAESTHAYKLAATDFAEWVFLPPLAKKLSTAAPSIKLEVEPLKEIIPLRDLEDGTIDIAIGYFSDAPGSLYAQELFSEDFVCVMKKTKKTPSKMTLGNFLELNHVLVAPWGGMVGLIDNLLSKQGKSRTVCISTTHFHVAPFITASTDYAVTLPRRVAEAYSTKLSLETFEVPVELPKFTFKQMWHKRNHDTPAHKWLRHEIHEIFKSN